MSAIVLVVFSAVVSLFTLAAIGGNDVANSQGTAVGSGAITLRGAQIVAGICEFAGAALVGHQVSNTIGSKMIDRQYTNITDLQYCWGMFSGLLSVGLWMIIATKIKMPVSATHSIIGALLGFNLVITHFNFNSMQWSILGKIAIAWIVTPLLSFGASYITLILLNIYWPSDHDRDANQYESQSLIEQPMESQRSSLISFVMAPPGPGMTPQPSPSPKRRDDREKKVRLTWATANEKGKTPDHATDVHMERSKSATEYFKPSKFKFAFIFGILMATLTVFIMVGGPKSINIADGHNKVDDWVVVVISISALIVFVIIGYLIEGCYRALYVKCIYSIKTQKNGDSVEMATSKGESNGITQKSKTTDRRETEETKNSKNEKKDIDDDAVKVVIKNGNVDDDGDKDKDKDKDENITEFVGNKTRKSVDQIVVDVKPITVPTIEANIYNNNNNDDDGREKDIKSKGKKEPITPITPKSRSGSMLSMSSLRNRMKGKGAVKQENSISAGTYSRLMEQKEADIYGTEEVDGSGSSDDEKERNEKQLKLKELEKEQDKKSRTEFDKNDCVEMSFNNQDYFRLYLIIASGAVAFAHGGNDVANVLGPFGQIYKYTTTGSIEGNQEIPIYVAAGAGLTIAIGFAMFGKPVLETIGKSITKLSYRSGFTAQFCAAATVLVCNVLGLPVSSSTVIVGGVAGVGLYNSKQQQKEKKIEITTRDEDVEYIGIGNKCKYLWQKKSIRILCKILIIWIITIPANATICGATYAFINVFL